MGCGPGAVPGLSALTRCCCWHAFSVGSRGDCTESFVGRQERVLTWQHLTGALLFVSGCPFPLSSLLCQLSLSSHHAHPQPCKVSPVGHREPVCTLSLQPLCQVSDHCPRIDGYPPLKVPAQPGSFDRRPSQPPGNQTPCHCLLGTHPGGLPHCNPHGSRP